MTTLPPLLADLVKRQNARRRWFAAIGGTTLIIVGAVLVKVIVTFAASMGRLSSMRPEELWPMIGGIVLALLGGLWIALALRRHPATALIAPGASVTKAYIYQVTRMGGGIYQRSLDLIVVLNGKQVPIQVGTSHDRSLDREANALLREVAQLHPRADIGWTSEDSEAAA